MIRFVNRKEIEHDRWNSIVKSSPYFRHYALTYFLDASCELWVALVKNDYEWIWPLPIKKWPVIQVIQPLLAQQLGPISNGTRALEESDIQQSWELIQRVFWKVNVKFSDHFSDLPMPCSKHTNVELELGKSHDELTKAFNRNSISNIRKSVKANVTFQCAEDFNPLAISVFRSGRGRGLSILDEEFYDQVRRIYSAFQAKGEAETWIAQKDGVTLAAVMLLNTNQRILNFFTSSTTQAKGVGAMHGLINAILEKHCDSAKFFDFEGSDDSNLAYFYKSFGGSERIYLQAQSGWRPPIFNRFLH
jgi:hypothetical protein